MGGESSAWAEHCTCHLSRQKGARRAAEGTGGLSTGLGEAGLSVLAPSGVLGKTRGTRWRRRQPDRNTGPLEGAGPVSLLRGGKVPAVFPQGWQTWGWETLEPGSQLLGSHFLLLEFRCRGKAGQGPVNIMARSRVLRLQPELRGTALSTGGTQKHWLGPSPPSVWAPVRLRGALLWLWWVSVISALPHTHHAPATGNTVQSCPHHFPSQSHLPPPAPTSHHRPPPGS